LRIKMETRRKRTLAYELMLDVAAVPLAERAQIMTGAEQFFEHGWPINHFTVGMAASAGMGLVPPIYEGLGSEGRYFQAMKPQVDAVRSNCQPNAPDSFASKCEHD
jgi:hypothetical protein